MLAEHINIDESLNTLVNNKHVQNGMLKLPQDLERYKLIIEQTKPEVIIETGTYTGASAQWFFELGIDVITIDVSHDALQKAFVPEGSVRTIIGDSIDPETLRKVNLLVGKRRAMVSLDSDHSTRHVLREIVLYGRLVTPSCYLVVEDGIFGYAANWLRKQHFPDGLLGSPLEAIELILDGNPDWSRDAVIEELNEVSHHPAGWWISNG